MAPRGQSVGTTTSGATRVLHLCSNSVIMYLMQRNARDALAQRSRTISAGVVRHGYLPLMLVGFNGFGIWLASQGVNKVLLLAILTAAVAVSFGAERIAPYEASWNGARADAGRDLLHALVNEGLQIGSLLALPLIVDHLAIEGLWPHDWPFVVQVLAAVVVADAGITLAHWASHKTPALWRFHAIHHSVQRFYGFNGLMKHPLHQLFETAVATTPLVVLGLPTQVATALVFMVGVQLLLQHSNADYAVGPLRHLMALNVVHRFHHYRWPGIGDVNFGLFTNVWDRLLRTTSWDPDKRFTSADIGIAKRPDFPTTYAAQLADPFRRPAAVAAPDEPGGCSGSVTRSAGPGCSLGPSHEEVEASIRPARRLVRGRRGRRGQARGLPIG